MNNLYKKWLSGLTFWIVCISVAFAQESSMKALSLNNMSSFQEQAGNWFIVGDVSMNSKINSPKVEPEKGKKKKNKNGKNGDGVNQPVTFEPGEGILLNMNSEEKKSQLVTNWEHGDIDLVIEFMLPKGSNSGVYLQGRYEIQLFDSWGVDNADYSDMGGIFKNWEEEPDKIFKGEAPLVNAAKAPGLWQTLKISFRAPQFNADGEKIAHAQFKTVELNGTKIHDNIEVPFATGGPIKNNEEPTGPLMIQGDHGPVAFRNIQYHLVK